MISNHCPVCTLELKPRDGVVHMGDYLVHGRCHGKAFARTTGGAAGVEPDARDERLVAKVAHYLYGKVVMREDHATMSAAADDYARNLVQCLILDFNITEKR